MPEQFVNRKTIRRRAWLGQRLEVIQPYPFIEVVQVQRANSRSATIWQHIKLAFAHQQSLLGPHGEYTTEARSATGTTTRPCSSSLTESGTRRSPGGVRLPAVAAAGGPPGRSRSSPRSFAPRARGRSRDAPRTVGRLVAGMPAATRGIRRVGAGVIFEEPQPWAMLAGAPTAAQVQAPHERNIHRYLDGLRRTARSRDAGPYRAAMAPAYGRPRVTKQDARCSARTSAVRQRLPVRCWQGASEWPGGVWFDLNGDLTWAYAAEDGVCRARARWRGASTPATPSRITPRSGRSTGTGRSPIDDVCFA